MSLDVTIYEKKRCKCWEYHKWSELYSANITHNLWVMASEAGIYEALRRPYMLKEWYIDQNDYKLESIYEQEQTIFAKDLIPIIAKWLKDMKKRPSYYRKFDSYRSKNWWWLYDNFVPWIEEYLKNLDRYDDWIVEVSR